MIISVGGSLIVPEKIDITFLREFKRIILSFLPQHRFVLICGGGRTARNYQEAARALGPLTSEDADWIGIHATRVNAQLLRTLFRQQAHPRIITDPTEKIRFKEKILIAAGWKPGFSTDYDAVLIAEQLQAKTIINLSNIDYVYDKDPRVHKDARAYTDISWKKFRSLIPKTWSPGLSSPFDPIASKHASRLGIIVAIINGKKLENLHKYLKGKPFIGTIIS